MEYNYINTNSSITHQSNSANFIAETNQTENYILGMIGLFAVVGLGLIMNMI